MLVSNGAHIGNGAGEAPRPRNEKEAAKALLGEPVALGYERDPSTSIWWTNDGTTLPYWLIVYDIPAMLAHPRVLFPLTWYKAGIANAKFTPKASSSAVADFAMAELSNFWERCLAPAQQVYDYGWLGAEARYEERQGLVRFHSMHTFHPMDCWAVTRGHRYQGLNVQNVNGWSRPGGATTHAPRGKAFLWGPSQRFPAKGIWFSHNRDYDRFYGKSQLYGAWRPWRRLATRDAAEEVADMAVHRYGVGGFIMYYPTLAYQNASGQTDFTMAREKSREFVETAKAGAVLAVPNARDKDGNRLWELQMPEHVLDVSGLIAYCQYLVKEVACGIGIPPELIEAAQTGSGYSGRMIPAIGYYASQVQNARNLVSAFCVQVLDPLLRWMFGPEASCEIKVDLIVPEELTGIPQPQEQVPGGGPQPGQPQPGQPQEGQPEAAPGAAAQPGAQPPPVESGAGGGQTAPYVGPRGGRWVRNLQTGQLRHAELATARDPDDPSWGLGLDLGPDVELETAKRETQHVSLTGPVGTAKRPRLPAGPNVRKADLGHAAVAYAGMRTKGPPRVAAGAVATANAPRPVPQHAGDHTKPEFWHGLPPAHAMGYDERKSLDQRFRALNPKKHADAIGAARQWVQATRTPPAPAAAPPPPAAPSTQAPTHAAAAPGPGAAPPQPAIRYGTKQAAKLGKAPAAPAAAPQPAAPAAQQQAIPAWMGTPKPQAPAPPEHWEERHMMMIPAAAQRDVANRLLKQGLAPDQAAERGRAVARHVEDYSPHPPVVYRRVLQNAYARGGDFERAKETARDAMGRAHQAMGGGAYTMSTEDGDLELFEGELPYELAAVHAPQGYTQARPLVIAGRPFVGGEFIPAEYLAQATPEQQQQLGLPGGRRLPYPNPPLEPLPHTQEAVQAIENPPPDEQEELHLAEALLLLTGAATAQEQPSVKSLERHYPPADPQGIDTLTRHQRPDGTFTPQRAALHEEIDRKMRAHVPATGERTYVTLGGGPASGKSTVTNSGLVRLPEHRVHVDSDEIKGHLPEYHPLIKAGDLRAAGFCHEESSHVSKEVQKRAYAAGQNVVLDGTGDNSLDNIRKRVKQVRDAGYKVHAEYVTCSTREALRRNFLRGRGAEAAKAAGWEVHPHEEGQKGTGRLPDEGFLQETHHSVSALFPKAAAEGLFDHARLWDTEHKTPDGRPTLVMSAEGNKVTVHHPQLWQKFLAKAQEKTVETHDRAVPHEAFGARVPHPTEEHYLGQALGNLKKTSRTASGVVDTSASAGKAAKMAEGLSGADAARHATQNVEHAMRALYRRREEPPKDAEQAMHLADTVNRQINHGITKPGVLERTDDSPKFPYTRVEHLPLARRQFAQELTKRLNDPHADPVETAAWIEWRANLTDHFWADGVGKTAKAMAAVPLMRAGLPLPKYPDNKEFFKYSQPRPIDPRQGGQAYLGEPWKKFLAFYRTLMPREHTMATDYPTLAPRGGLLLATDTAFEQAHPRESSAHDAKRPGEFAPKRHGRPLPSHPHYVKTDEDRAAMEAHAPAQLAAWRAALEHHHGLPTLGAKARHRPKFSAAYAALKKAYEAGLGRKLPSLEQEMAEQFPEQRELWLKEHEKKHGKPGAAT